MMEITTPTFGRLQDYVGVWAMEPRAAAMLYERMRSIDLKSHVPQTLDSPPKVKSQIGIVQSSSGQNVAVLMLTGPLMKALSSADESGTSTVQLRRDIRKAANDPNVSAIVLAIDSPGGTVAGTADLAAEVVSAKQKKPVMAFIDDLGGFPLLIGLQAKLTQSTRTTKRHWSVRLGRTASFMTPAKEQNKKASRRWFLPLGRSKARAHLAWK